MVKGYQILLRIKTNNYKSLYLSRSLQGLNCALLESGVLPC